VPSLKRSARPRLSLSKKEIFLYFYLDWGILRLQAGTRPQILFQFFGNFKVSGCPELFCFFSGPIFVIEIQIPTFAGYFRGT
jgi:hypothetical protein